MNYLPWRLTLLGSLRAEANGGTAIITRFRSQKTASLFAYLASHPEHSHPREALVDKFWPDDDPEAGRNSLRVALAALRRELEPEPLAAGSVLATDRFAVGFVLGAVLCDVVSFDSALKRAGRSEGEARAAVLTEAVACYTGPLLPGFYDDWISEERERLQAAFEDALERLADYHEARKDPGSALECAERLALEQDAAPDDPHSRRVERLRHQAAETERQAARSAAEAAGLPFLPVPVDRLVGRDGTIADLSSLLLLSQSQTRLVTLIGPGGTGKTRVALETARRLQQTVGAHSVCFVPLVEVNEPHRILEAVRDALRLPRNTSSALSEGEVQQSLQEQILLRLNGSAGNTSPFLLVLDNFEQLTERWGGAAATVINRLLRSSERLVCLVTSRRRLGITGERLYTVPPLAVPPVTTKGACLEPDALAQVASVALFTERARSVNPDFVLTSLNAAVVAELCTRLEGLPLAIELAAAWSSSLSPTKMLARLEERFALLASVRRQDKTDRHRSLWATIAWSYDLLPGDLRQLWVNLSVFRGGWTAEGAAALASADQSGTGIQESLARLRERSLIVPVGEDADGEMRFTLLESLREWAALQLNTDAALKTSQCHAAYFYRLMEISRDKMRGPDEKVWLERCEAEHDNLRTACDFYYEHSQASEAKALDGLRLSSLLSFFWRKRGYLLEARQRLDRFLSLPILDSQTLDRGKALNSAGLTAWMQNDLDAATAYYEDALQLFRAIQDTTGIGKVLSNLSLIAMERNDYPQVIALASESLTLHRSAGDRLSEAMSLGNLGNVYLETDDYARGKEQHRQALEIYRELGDNEGITISLSGLAYAAVQMGERNEACRLFREALIIRRSLSDLWRICFSLTSIADFLCGEGKATIAAQLYGAVETLRESIGAPFSEVRQKEFDEKCTFMRGNLGEAAYSAAYAAGKFFTHDDAVALALAHCETEETAE